jgi:hypothetical protein
MRAYFPDVSSRLFFGDLETVPPIARTSHDSEEALHRLCILPRSVYKCELVISSLIYIAKGNDGQGNYPWYTMLYGGIEFALYTLNPIDSQTHGNGSSMQRDSDVQTERCMTRRSDIHT